MIQLTLTLKMTTAQVVKTSVICTINNSPTQNCEHPDDYTCIYSTYYNLWIRIINEILTKNIIMKHKSHSHQV